MPAESLKCPRCRKPLRCEVMNLDGRPAVVIYCTGQFCLGDDTQWTPHKTSKVKQEEETA